MRHESVHRRGPSESGHIPTPASTAVKSATPTTTPTAMPQAGESTGGALMPPLNKHFWVCNSLRTVIPSRAAVDAILAASPGTPYVVSMCYSEAERREGRPDPASSISSAPPLTAHPLSLAKRALQVLICIQQLPPGFDWEALATGADMSVTSSRLSNTSTLVTSNDELMGYAEGIECLILQGFYQANDGNLRKAWITARRALSLAQMLGIPKGRSIAFRSCDPNADPAHRTSAEVLWSKVVYWERYLSLLLGLSIGSQGIEIPPTTAPSNPIDRLEKAHAALSARIGERNASHQRDPTRHLSIYALTQEIDLELEAAATSVPPDWWDEPRLDPLAATQDSLWDATAKILVQMHHFTLALLLHVPYMLRDLGSHRYDYSKTTCMSAARGLLSRFSAFRTHRVCAYSCRRADYAGLIAAMTLCLSYLGKRRSEVWEDETVRNDVSLIGGMKRRMEHVARVSRDRLSREAVSIIDRLAPIVERAAGQGGPSGQRDTPREVQFNVPFMGAISIKMPSGAAEWQGGHRRHPSSATGALERMALGSPTQPQQQRAPGSSSETDTPAYSDAGFLHFAPYDSQASLLPSGADKPGVEQQPDFMAGGEEWALQGVDAAYWSLFEGVGI